MLEIKNLTKNYGSVKVLRGINLKIKQGEIVGMVGSSGAGKTTILRCINQIEEPTSGQVLVDGVDIVKHNAESKKALRKVGMVFQQFNLFPHLTALENLILSPMKVDKQSRAQAVKKAKEVLKKLGIYDKLDVYPGQLSGGQQQRLAIARELTKNPEILLFDEPTSSLDPENVDEVQTIIKGLSKEGLTVIIVSHDVKFILEIATRVIFLEKGTLVADESPAKIIRSTNKRVSSFFQAGLN